ncbi:MAG TPA: hypothetical protein PLW14_03025 [Chlorobiota bacterium]|nr:hypothetical protein [Chlorobiota bacterium]
MHIANMLSAFAAGPSNVSQAASNHVRTILVLKAALDVCDVHDSCNIYR